MAINKQKKQEIVKELREKIGRAKSVVFTKFFGVGANEINDLRGKIKDSGSEYMVAKKTLVDVAFADQKIEGLKVRDIEGEVAAVFGYEDEVAPAKIIDEFKKSHESVELMGGVLENKFIDAAQVQALAKMPSKPELYAKIVGSIKAPISGFVNVLSGNLRGLVTVLKAIEEKKQ
ncbi:MAG: 50S ribosomal protein L10 [Patescibacteria group bacterium]|jgi:large subunit ribosomal protein L10